MPAHRIPQDFQNLYRNNDIDVEWVDPNDFAPDNNPGTAQDRPAILTLAFTQPVSTTAGNHKYDCLQLYVTPTTQTAGTSNSIRAIEIVDIDEDIIAASSPVTVDRAIHVGTGWSVAMRIPDDCELLLGQQSESGLQFSTRDDTNTEGALVLFLDNDSQVIHVTDRGARDTDWDYGDGETDPTIVLHSNTTPITDYMRIGAHDGSNAHIDVVSGNLSIDIDGTQMLIVNSNGIRSQGLVGTSDGGTQTQATDINTTVTLNTNSGQITTVSATIAAGANETFTVSCNKVAATDAVLLSIGSYGGAGTPVAHCTAVGAGSFDVTLQNIHSADSLNAVVQVNYVVIKGASS